MKIVKILSCIILVGFMGAVVADNLFLHKQVDILQKEIKEYRNIDPVMKELKALRADIKTVKTDFNRFEKITVEKEKATADAVDKIESWIETSSVQGKWNGYKREFKDWRNGIVEKYRKVKESVEKKIDELKDND